MSYVQGQYALTLKLSPVKQKMETAVEKLKVRPILQTFNFIDWKFMLEW